MSTVRSIGWLLLAGVIGVSQPVQAAEHPTLVSAAEADCTVCHEGLLEDRSVVHPPVADDCTSCHEFSNTGAGTQVSLMAEEPELCVFCHDDLAAAVEADLSVPHFPVTDSCLTCHDPHATKEPSLLTAPPAELCATCHDPSDLGTSHDGQITPATRCAQCHEPHGSENERMLASRHQHRPFADGSCSGCHRAPFGERIRLRARGERLCTACHGDLSEEGADGGSVHAALVGERGRAGCLSCHDPHMSERSSLLLRETNATCGRCHADVVGAAGSENGHYPAGEDCTNCHRPHASPQASLLDEPALDLCRMCHDAEDEDLSRTHLGADLSGLDCLGCHEPHGSEHGRLLQTHLHPPVLDGCETCHEGASDQLMEGGAPELCLICHDDVGERASSADVPHAALELGSCTDCHNPHASAQPNLVKAPRGQVCTECHDDKAPEKGEVAHGVIEQIGCEACHEPHGGSRSALLRAEADQLCRSCHDARKVKAAQRGGTVRVLDRFDLPAEQALSVALLELSRDGQHGHPLPGHRVSGTPGREELKRTETVFQGELSCLTCHDPHKGRSRQILRWEAASPADACLHCHPK